MKRLLTLSLILLLTLTACTHTMAQSPATPDPAAVETTTATPEPAPTAEPSQKCPWGDALPEECPLEFTFASGVGGWSTQLVLEANGSFRGFFHDSDMGSTGPGYPGGTYYYSNFHGSFTDSKCLGNGGWALTLREIHTEEDLGLEEIKEMDYDGGTVGVLHISAEPYGMERGRDFLLYGPDTPIEGLDEEFLSWWPGRYEEGELTTLCCYGLWNKETGYGFFTDLTIVPEKKVE